MKIDIETKIEHWKRKAEVFLENNIKGFIKTLDGTFHSCNILFVGDIYLTIFDFVKQENFRLYWMDVIFFDEYKEVRE